MSDSLGTWTVLFALGVCIVLIGIVLANSGVPVFLVRLLQIAAFVGLTRLILGQVME